MDSLCQKECTYEMFTDVASFPFKKMVPLYIIFQMNMRILFLYLHMEAII